jgi:hypothetical protein
LRLLILSLKYGHLQYCLRSLIEQTTDTNEYHAVALRFSAIYGHLEIIKFLVERGVIIDANKTQIFII